MSIRELGKINSNFSKPLNELLGDDANAYFYSDRLDTYVYLNDKNLVEKINLLLLQTGNLRYVVSDTNVVFFSPRNS